MSRVNFSHLDAVSYFQSARFSQSLGVISEALAPSVDLVCMIVSSLMSSFTIENKNTVTVRSNFCQSYLVSY